VRFLTYPQALAKLHNAMARTVAGAPGDLLRMAFEE